jgi:hypothetical protein
MPGVQFVEEIGVREQASVPELHSDGIGGLRPTLRWAEDMPKLMQGRAVAYVCADRPVV